MLNSFHLVFHDNFDPEIQKLEPHTLKVWLLKGKNNGLFTNVDCEMILSTENVLLYSSQQQVYPNQLRGPV